MNLYRTNYSHHSYAISNLLIIDHITDPCQVKGTLQASSLEQILNVFAQSRIIPTHSLTVSEVIEYYCYLDSTNKGLVRFSNFLLVQVLRAIGQTGLPDLSFYLFLLRLLILDLSDFAPIQSFSLKTKRWCRSQTTQFKGK